MDLVNLLINNTALGNQVYGEVHMLCNFNTSKLAIKMRVEKYKFDFHQYSFVNPVLECNRDDSIKRITCKKSL